MAMNHYLVQVIRQSTWVQFYLNIYIIKLEP